MYIEPTSHVVDVANGLLGNASGTYQKRLSDLQGVYADEQSYEAALMSKSDHIVYKVTDYRRQNSYSDLIFGVTNMAAGKIGDKFYMTRGHIHALANRPETYY